MKNIGILLGLVAIILGGVFLFNSFSGITGYAVLENSSYGFSGIIAACFIIGGLLLIVAEINEKIQNKEAKNAFRHTKKFGKS